MWWQNDHIFYVPVGLKWWSHSEVWLDRKARISEFRIFFRFKLVNHLTEFWYIVFLWFIFFLIESTKNTYSGKTQMFKDTTNKETESQYDDSDTEWKLIRF